MNLIILQEKKDTYRHTQRLFQIFTFILLLAFLTVGMNNYKDYGLTIDETHQIRGTLQLYDYVTGKLFGSDPRFPELGSFERNKNRYYGFAAYLPILIIDLLKDFSLDISTLIRIRHLYFFLTFFIGILCFTWMTFKRWGNWIVTFCADLTLIMLPRIFGDAFYNDRDVLFLSWFIITSSMFLFTMIKPSPFTAVLSGCCLALTITTRIFGICLIIIPFLYFVQNFKDKKSRNAFFLILISTLLFWYIMYPLAWSDPLSTIPEAINHLFHQRSIDTNGLGINFFMGKPYLESNLPWYYLPVWIFISTPVIASLFFIFGFGICIIRNIHKKKKDFNVFDLSFVIIFLFYLLFNIIVRPILYNGWRHFFFLYVPIVWFCAYFFNIILQTNKIKWLILSFTSLLVSFSFTFIWMINSHPYEITYFNPLIRSYATENFEYYHWGLADKESVDFIASDTNKGVIRVSDNSGYSYLHDLLKSFPSKIRNRFELVNYNSLTEPADYIIRNYQYQTNIEVEPNYVPVYKIERDGHKMTEIFARSHNYELRADQVLITTLNNIVIESINDKDYNTYIEFEDPSQNNIIDVILSSPMTINEIELYCLTAPTEPLSLSISGSEDNIHYVPIDVLPLDLYSYQLFSSFPVKYLRIESIGNLSNPSGIREMIIHGNE